MKKVIALLVIFSLMACALWGCGGNEAEEADNKPSAVCYVVGATGSRMGFDLRSPMLEQLTYDCARNYGYVAIVAADGAPEVVASGSLDIEDRYKNAAGELLEADARAKQFAVIEALANTMADDPNVDFLEALSVATRCLSGLRGEYNKTIYVLGTGLSNCGTMNFCNNILSADVDTIVSALSDKQAIPDFSDIHIYWQNCADTAVPQAPLSSAQTKKLKALWSAIIREGQGTLEFNDTMPVEPPTDVSFPSMISVDISPEEPISFISLTQETATPTEMLSVPIEISEEVVRFKEDSWELLDPEKTLQDLTPMANLLIHDAPDVKLLLAGCIAGDVNTDFGFELSLKRALAIKEILVSLGVAGDRLECVGCASSDPWHIYGLTLDSPASMQNRKVILIDIMSPEAEQILMQEDLRRVSES